jgi:unspecific monooxygenase
VSVAEIVDFPVKRGLLVPPRPPVAPQSMSTLSRMMAVRHNMIATWGARAYEEDILQGGLLGRASFIVNSPDAIRHVLVENYENYGRTSAGIRVLLPMLGQGLLLSEGRPWKLQRRTLAPAFSPRAVTTLVPHMHAAIGETIAKLDGAVDRSVELREAMQRMALDIAGRTMFSFEIARHGAALRHFVNDYGSRLAQPDIMDILFPGNWPTPRDLPRALFRRRWRRFIASLIAERRAMGTDPANPRDLFDLMVAARDPETGEGFSDENLGDQVATMILAGHETTATALFWSLYLLALDPETQDRVASEARAVAADGEPDFSRLAFTRAVIDETMRLYPPAFIIARAAKGRDIIDGRSVRKGDVVIISPWLLHRHNKLWREPDVFMPARFLPGAPPPEKFSYLPFGVGPRVCIGAHFALTEATLALARIVGTFNVSLLSTRPAIPLGVVTTQPDHSPEFRIERR